MYGLTIRQDNHAQKPILHFRHLNPTPDMAVRLYVFRIGARMALSIH